MKTLFIAGLVILIGTASCGKKAADERTSAHSDAIGKAAVTTALQVSEMDVSALSGLTEKLKGACARNKYGLSEETCIQTIDDRKDICMQQTAQKYPGQLANADRMQEVLSSHLSCLFQK